MEYKDRGPYSEFMYYVADNETQFNLADLLWDELGGLKFKTFELDEAFGTPEFGGVLVQSTFVITAPRKSLTRVWLGHGTSDKLIKKFEPPTSILGMDYYLTSGPKDKYLWGKFGHAVFHPYNKCLMTGLLRSDFFLNPELKLDKQTCRENIGISTDRPVVLFAPTFNTGSFEYYEWDLLDQLKDDFFFLVKVHDREFYRTSSRIRGRDGDQPFDLDPEFEKRLHDNYLVYRGKHEPLEFIAAADYYIGDSSSMDYEALFADIPMVMIKPYHNVAGDIPYEFDIRNICPYYARGDKNLMELLEQAKEPGYQEDRHDFIERCFSFNDGNAIQRTCEYMMDLVERHKETMAGNPDPNWIKMEAASKQILAGKQAELKKQGV
jgi:hypothetical protein